MPALVAVPGREAAVARGAARAAPAHACWRKGAIPARFHYGTQPARPAVSLPGRDRLADRRRPRPTKPFDAAAITAMTTQPPDMRALFIANGPAFARGQAAAARSTMSTSRRCCATCSGCPPATGLDGDDAPFRARAAREGATTMQYFEDIAVGANARFGRYRGHARGGDRLRRRNTIRSPSTCPTRRRRRRISGGCRRAAGTPAR